MPKTTAPDLIGTTEACQILSVDKSTLSRWVKFGSVAPAKRLSERGPMLFDRAAIERLAAERKTA
jgi:predicted site-specific integrase-resolvase